MEKKRIVIIDDDPGIIDVLNIILESEGYETKTIDDDTELFKIVEDFKPDLVLLDVWMPGLGGKEICRRLKQEQWSKKIPVLIVSASVNITDVSKDCGADGYISKPFDMDELTAIVKKYIDGPTGQQ